MNPTQNKYTNKQALADARDILDQAKAQAQVQGQAQTVQTSVIEASAPVAPGGPVSPPAPGYGNYGVRAATTASKLPGGQHLTPKGNLSTLNKGMTLKRRIRIEKAARLCATGLYQDKQIADHLGITPQYLTQLKTTKEFQSASMAVLTGVLSQENDAALTSVEERREELEAMVPAALMRLRNLVLSRNENVALKAVSEILNRDGHLVPVSRSTVELKKTEDMSSANAAAQSILDILRTTSQSVPIDGGIAPDFTVSAATAKVQIEDMSEKINEQTLESIDLSGKSVN